MHEGTLKEQEHIGLDVGVMTSGQKTQNDLLPTTLLSFPCQIWLSHPFHFNILTRTKIKAVHGSPRRCGNNWFRAYLRRLLVFAAFCNCVIVQHISKVDQRTQNNSFFT